jgi:hypothetical protein
VSNKALQLKIAGQEKNQACSSGRRRIQIRRCQVQHRDKLWCAADFLGTYAATVSSATLKPDDFVDNAFWLISMPLAASNAFFFLEVF